MQPTRQEFLHIPAWQQILFYSLTTVCVLYMAWQLFLRAKLWLRGRKVDWKSDSWKNIAIYLLGQKKVQFTRQKSGAPMHMLIFYGFLALLLATTLLGINTYSPVKFHKGIYYLVYELTFDLLGMLFVTGMTWAIIRRKFSGPKTLVSDRQSWLAAYLLLALGLTGYVLEGARIANTPHNFDVYSPIGYLLARAMPGVSDGVYVVIWWLHVVLFFGFLLSLPHMRLRHMVTSIFSAVAKPDRPMGELRAVYIEEVEQTEKIGAVMATDYSRWHLASLDACMECGRCTEVCPANLVGKTLDPRSIVQSTWLALKEGKEVAASASEEAFWECTTCNACVESCPVLIRHVDLIVDARRNLVSQGRMPSSAAAMLRQMSGGSNAWGAGSSADREEWMKDLGVPLARDRQKFEYLFWVGCAGATDPLAIRTTKALAELMNKAGIDYACLGNEESCTGDPARRIGEEFLFQEMANMNLSNLARYTFDKIVTACPHCMNTMLNEYPQFGKKYDVVHHSQLLSGLIAQGKLLPAREAKGEVTFHDPCYLARVNRECDAPRIALGDPAGMNSDDAPLLQWIKAEPIDRNLAEPGMNGTQTLCCGAGGGRMWMEEPVDKRPSSNRIKQLIETGAKTIAVACPFCRVMIDAGMKQETDETIRLADIAELVKEANSQT